MIEEIKHYKESVHINLLLRQIFFLILTFVLLVISIVNVFQEKVGGVLAASGFGLSTAIGLCMSRMFKIFWHTKKEKVVAHLDMVGVILLIVYVGLEISRKWLFEHWLSGAALNAFGLIVVTGLLLGRFLGTTIQINQAITENVIE